MDTDCLKPIAEGDTQELLKQAAKGELLLYVALHPFTAKLQAQSWAKSPKQSEWTNNTGEHVPLNPGAAKGLSMFPDAQVAWFEPDGSWQEEHPLHDHVWLLNKPQTVTREQVYFESSGSTEGLDVFKTIPNLTADKVTVRLLRKDENSLPDSVVIEAGGHKRTVACNKIGLASEKGRLNREGLTLQALSHGQIPRSVKTNGQPLTKASLAQAIKKLRKIFKGIGITDDPFMRTCGTWEPRFKLLDAIKQADKRAALRALPSRERIKRSKSDAADIWLQKHDK